MVSFQRGGPVVRRAIMKLSLINGRVSESDKRRTDHIFNNENIHRYMRG